MRMEGRMQRIPPVSSLLPFLNQQQLPLELREREEKVEEKEEEEEEEEERG